jgi:hypothetical protein
MAAIVAIAASTANVLASILPRTAAGYLGQKIREGTHMSGTGATETQNIAVIRRGYEAFGKGDIETLKTLFAPNAIWHSIGAGVLP